MALNRADIDKKYKWDLSRIYSRESDFEADFKSAEEMAAEYGRYREVMAESGEKLYTALRALTDMEQTVEKLWQFAHLSYSVDTSDNTAQGRMGRVRSLAVRVDSASWFVSPSLIAMDEVRLNRFFGECPALESYRRQIYLVRRRGPYTLSDECEKLVSRLGDCFGSHADIRSALSNSDMRFGKITGSDGKPFELDESCYLDVLMSGERAVRRRAFKRLYKRYSELENTYAAMFNSYVKEKCSLAAARGFGSAREASVFRDEVTTEIYDNLINSVGENLEPLYDYYELKREMLGLPRLHLYDVYSSVCPADDRKYDYEEAVKEVLSMAEVFGEEYHGAMKEGLTERGWVDVYPTKAKRSGAFSSGCPSTEPYILMNYTGSYSEVSTLAHEGGHSMHSYFSQKYNEPHNSGYTIFVAEVASTVNELLLAHKKLRESENDGERLYILDKIMDMYRATLYRQTMFAEFERDVYAEVERGQTLTADALCKAYKSLVDKYFGPRVVTDEPIRYEWARIPHFYMNFYVYKYATCISAASAIVKRIEAEGEAYIGKYIEFLKCGGARSPLESLMVAGIDMTDPDVIMGAVEDFKGAIAEFRRIKSGA